MDIQAAKDLVWEIWQSTISEGPRSSWPVESAFDQDCRFFGPAPIGTLTGRSALFETVYQPLAHSFLALRREPYLFLGGVFESQTWVATTGDFTGVFERNWLGIPATGREARLRFGEFYRVKDSRVQEIRCLFDVLGLAAQAGYDLLPPFEGRADVPPGPVLRNGLSRAVQDPNETGATLDLVEGMVGGCNRLDERGLASMGMDRFWHTDMVWHGPWGIGSCHGFQEFQDYAQGPSVASFPDRRGGHHQARIADGVTAAFTGWPSLQGTFNGAPFHGLAPTGKPIGMNLMDFYVRRGDRLHENWVLIDLIDFWAQCGVDLLARLPSGPGHRSAIG